MRYLTLSLDWIELHPVFFALIAWPVLTGVIGTIFKHRTEDELNKLPRPFAWFLRFIRSTGLDLPMATKLLWGALTRNKVPMPEVEAEKAKSLAPPPLPKINGDYAAMDKEHDDNVVVINTIQEVPKESGK